jgi:regulator of replication initiation timing
MENPYMTETIAQEIVNALYYKKKIHLGEASFCVGGMNDPGDIFYIQDCETENWIYMLAASIKCTFDGGVRTEIASGNSTDAESDSSAISSSGGSAISSLSTQMSQLQQELEALEEQVAKRSQISQLEQELEALKEQVAKQPEIQHKNERIGTTTAGETVSTEITFAEAFSKTPHIYVTPHTTNPNVAVATVSDSSKTGFTLNVVRSSKGTTSVDWLAIN